MQDWPTLCKLRAGSYVDFLKDATALEDGVYKISDAIYCLADSVLEAGAERIQWVSLFWACSEPAFRRVYFREIENDDKAECAPPVELLPSGAGMNYGSIRDALRCLDPERSLECASYRIMSDGAFVHKTLEGRRATYYFRSAEIIESELPYAILWRS